MSNSGLLYTRQVLQNKLIVTMKDTIKTYGLTYQITKAKKQNNVCIYIYIYIYIIYIYNIYIYIYLFERSKLVLFSKENYI